MRTDYYIYVYRDPRDGQPLYVGKGKRYRSVAHLQLKRHKNSAFSEALVALAAIGLSPDVEIVAHFQCEEEAYRAEADLIRKIGRRIVGEGPLLNVDPGGNGGRKRAPSTVEKIRAASRKVWEDPAYRERAAQAAKVWTAKPGVKDRMSRQALKSWSDPDFSQGRSPDAVGRWQTEEYREKMRGMMEKRSADPAFRMRMSQQKAAAYGTDEFRKRMAAIKAGQYADPEQLERFRARRRATMEARGLWKKNTTS